MNQMYGGGDAGSELSNQGSEWNPREEDHLEEAKLAPTYSHIFSSNPGQQFRVDSINF